MRERERKGNHKSIEGMGRFWKPDCFVCLKEIGYESGGV